MFVKLQLTAPDYVQIGPWSNWACFSPKTKRRFQLYHAFVWIEAVIVSRVRQALDLSEN